MSPILRAMSTMPRTLTALALALALAACGSDDTTADPDASPPPTAPTASPEPTSAPAGSPAASPTATDTAPEVRTVAVEVRGGEVVGGTERVEVAVGETLRLEVTSDVADRVHVHGYDLERPVDAGATVTVEFTADIPGVFEVELEDRGLQLLELEVGG